MQAKLWPSCSSDITLGKRKQVLPIDLGIKILDYLENILGNSSDTFRNLQRKEKDFSEGIAKENLNTQEMK